MTNALLVCFQIGASFTILIAAARIFSCGILKEREGYDNYRTRAPAKENLRYPRAIFYSSPT